MMTYIPEIIITFITPIQSVFDLHEAPSVFVSSPFDGL